MKNPEYQAIPNISDLVEHYFKDHFVLYFQQNDAHTNVEGDPYLKCYKDGGKIELWMGGNSGEVCITKTNDPVKLEMVLKALLYQ